MKLNSKGLLPRYHEWIFGYLPEDICSYFWNCVFSILFIVLCVPGRLVFTSTIKQRDISGYGNRVNLFNLIAGGALLWVIPAAMTLIGYGALEKNEIFKMYPLHIQLLISFGVALAGCLAGVLFIGICFGLVYLGSRVHDIVSSAKSTNDVVDTIAAVKGKYCTKITWEGKNNQNDQEL